MSSAESGELSWSEYVRHVIGEQRQVDVAAKTTVNQTTISRWINDEHRSITPLAVSQFARGMGVPVVEAFVHAGLLTADDVKVRAVTRRTLREVDTDALLSEIQRRVTGSMRARRRAESAS